MAVKKHKLTTQTDKIGGVKGNDLYSAPASGAKGTLSNKDVLDGKGGDDTISALLAGNKLTPRLANIEKGIFTRKSTQDLTLDLGKAAKMASVTLNSFDADVTLNKAKALSSFALSKSTDDVFTLNGLDSDKIVLEKLSFNAVTNGTLAINTITGTNLKEMDVTLNASSVTLKDEALGATVTINSMGTAANSLTFANLATTGLQKLTITGSAALDISKSGSLAGLTSFDASKMDGGLTANLGGAGLISVLGGKGADQLKIDSLGTPTTGKATVDLDAGDDVLDGRAMTIDATKMSLIGGAGSDTLRLRGAATGLGIAGFETIEITNAIDDYVLNGDVTTLNFVGATGPNTIITGGTSLTKITGDAGVQNIDLTAIGSPTTGKAMVDLGAGDDAIALTAFALNSTTQFYDGGLGNDLVAIAGSATNLSALFDNFETLFVVNGTGSYNFANTYFNAITLFAPSAAATFDNVASGTTISISSIQNAHKLTVNVTPTAGNDILNLNINGNICGDLSNGAAFSGVDVLNITSIFAGGALYLEKVGSAVDAATVTIAGGGDFTLFAANNATNYVDNLTITNTAGVNLTSINGNSFFSTSGATITGGDGNDVLFGGLGSDIINPGKGANVIRGSLLSDTINLVAGGGVDTFEFSIANQSLYGIGGDVIKNFELQDRVDISGMGLTGQFTGNVGSMTDGNATLAAGTGNAFFFNKALYIDANKDGNISSGVDMIIQLEDVVLFDASQLLYI